jgi:hypothetical protein
LLKKEEEEELPSSKIGVEPGTADRASAFGTGGHSFTISTPRFSITAAVAAPKTPLHMKTGVDPSI